MRELEVIEGPSHLREGILVFGIALRQLCNAY